MPVYVDESAYKFGNMIMCHMLADTPDELHAMADAIGVARRWFQRPPKASTPHYDVCKTMREKAVALGAIEVDRCDMAEISRRVRRVWGASVGVKLTPVAEVPDSCVPEWVQRCIHEHLGNLSTWERENLTGRHEGTPVPANAREFFTFTAFHSSWKAGLSSALSEAIPSSGQVELPGPADIRIEIARQHRLFYGLP